LEESGHDVYYIFKNNFLEWLRINTKTLYPNSRYPERDMNPESTEYQTELITTD
jgi:hypothetical protein